MGFGIGYPCQGSPSDQCTLWQRWHGQQPPELWTRTLLCMHLLCIPAVPTLAISHRESEKKMALYFSIVSMLILGMQIIKMVYSIHTFLTIEISHIQSKLFNMVEEERRSRLLERSGWVFPCGKFKEWRLKQGKLLTLKYFLTWKIRKSIQDAWSERWLSLYCLVKKSGVLAEEDKTTWPWIWVPTLLTVR